MYSPFFMSAFGPESVKPGKPHLRDGSPARGREPPRFPSWRGRPLAWFSMAAASQNWLVKG